MDEKCAVSGNVVGCGQVIDNKTDSMNVAFRFIILNRAQYTHSITVSTFNWQWDFSSTKYARIATNCKRISGKRKRLARLSWSIPSHTRR